MRCLGRLPYDTGSLEISLSKPADLECATALIMNVARVPMRVMPRIVAASDRNYSEFAGQLNH